jgi:AcrR family transcriptional regulator
LLDCAEELFAERGFSGVSLREIVIAAGANIAAANYHFGTKEELFEQVFLRCAEPVTECWIKLVREAEAQADAPDHLEQLVRAVLMPSFTTIALDPVRLKHFNRLRVHIFNENREFAQPLINKVWGPVATHIAEVFQSALPQLDQSDFAWRMHIFLGSVVFTSMPAARLHTIVGPEPYHPENSDEAMRYLVPLITAVWRAPVSSAAEKRSPSPRKRSSPKRP